MKTKRLKTIKKKAAAVAKRKRRSMFDSIMSAAESDKLHNLIHSTRESIEKIFLGVRRFEDHLVEDHDLSRAEAVGITAYALKNVYEEFRDNRMAKHYVPHSANQLFNILDETVSLVDSVERSKAQA